MLVKRPRADVLSLWISSRSDLPPQSLQANQPRPSRTAARPRLSSSSELKVTPLIKPNTEPRASLVRWLRKFSKATLEHNMAAPPQSHHRAPSAVICSEGLSQVSMLHHADLGGGISYCTEVGTEA
ncbi:unnamed protein product [Pleuronectes platessa]|uniref:Uncharacterized protein n=1 Tax=Pleuronectes platessa TaxID=8262 RepID=A0A9N7VER8_PLEPL|nr:unnamed protein product [Pleuronectes platessa]